MNNSALKTFTDMNSGKQIGIIASITISIVAIIMVMLWGTSPSYRVLYSNLNGEDASSIMDQLSKDGIDYKLNEQTGSILVERDQVYKVRLNLSSIGLPKSSENLDFFDGDQSLSLSKSMESAKLKKMMELELSRTIDFIDGISQSRVHIAIPPNSVFSRERGDVTASVIVNTSEKLSNSQIKSILSLVSKSVPRLTTENVSVVDSRGNLLSINIDKESKGSGYTEKMENTLEARINDILGKIVGGGNVSSKVSLEIDFNKTDQTNETFAPNSGQIRSEIWSENVVSNPNADNGQVPGALTNQPLITDVTDVAQTESKPSSDIIKKKDGSFTKNYEIDRSITHVSSKSPSIKRITVAVILNSQSTTDKDGKITYRNRSEEELAEFKKIVENTVGFQASRKDSVVVISRQFEVSDITSFNDEITPDKWWESELALEGGKWGSVVISILLIIFLIIRPLIKNIFAKEEEEVRDEADEVVVDKSMADELRESESKFSTEMDEVRSIAKDDPAIVAQVVKNWIKEEGENDE